MFSATIEANSNYAFINISKFRQGSNNFLSVDFGIVLHEEQSMIRQL